MTDLTAKGGAAPNPAAEFADYGAVEVTALSRIQMLVGAALHRSWTTIPHVTHHDEADITTLEPVRQRLAAQADGVKLTPLVFLIKAAVAALREFPGFNASLDPSGKYLVLKKYFHIGIAIDTPGGLLVGVIRDCDRKDWRELAGDITALSAKARGRGLSLQEMSGGCFTISSLGNLGGTGFTPIINPPEVAILGVSRSHAVARPDGAGGIDWRTSLPLSLSYDHRVINGAAAARFTRFLAQSLADPEALLGL